MYKIEIGAGFVVTALAGFNLLESLTANIILVVLGCSLILHGSYEVFFKPHMFLEKRIGNWLLSRHWIIRKEKNPQFDFIIWAEDNSHREVAITKSNGAKGILVFSASITKGKDWGSELARLTTSQRKQLIEDIIVFFTSKDIAYVGAIWPLDRLAVQHALRLDSQLSEHLVDLKAKEVINAVIGIRSLIRKAIIPLEPDKEGSQTE